jgi:hypothetical protein
MEQQITHYYRGKLHVGQITVRDDWFKIVKYNNND